MSCVLAYSPPGDAQGLQHLPLFVFLFHAQKILVHLQVATWLKKVLDHKFMHSTQYLLAHRYVVYVCLCISMEWKARYKCHPYTTRTTYHLKNHWIGLPTSPWAAGHHSDPPVRLKDWEGFPPWDG